MKLIALHVGQNRHFFSKFDVKLFYRSTATQLAFMIFVWNCHDALSKRFRSTIISCCSRLLLSMGDTCFHWTISIELTPLMCIVHCHVPDSKEELVKQVSHDSSRLRSVRVPKRFSTGPISQPLKDITLIEEKEKTAASEVFMSFTATNIFMCVTYTNITPPFLNCRQTMWVQGEMLLIKGLQSCCWSWKRKIS